ncbi:hypothetical protein DYBT9275_03585 [Dyadobacter sp. CECT 9275]|uniref:ABC transport system permease protein n=1 Tax=Dyadobacter helix TaxID=2822344 RepID=A0A916JGH1_9BACT|nr:ABC transporter permease [Dyadobacter sp. CECT 9275]CAG5005459.1 hypothetical protein DYBT9275_03585 [Dyadobacter sp. CECT 9275]
MIRNYIKIALRNLLKNKVYTGINIFGLALGLTACLLIILYISEELSFDKHHKDADRIFRIATLAKTNTSVESEKWVAVAGPVAGGLISDFPEIEQITRIMRFPGFDRMLLKYEPGEKQFYETNGYYADSSIFQVLTYDFKYGDPLKSLHEPNTLVLSETLSAKLFGKQNPLGKVISIGLPFGNFNYTVSGVFRDNQKSHINAHFFLSMRNGDLGGWVDSQGNWATNNLFHTYIKLRAGSDAHAFEAKLPAFMARHAAADLKALGISKSFFLQPLRDIYLRSNFDNELSPNGSMTYLYIFGSIAAFLLLIACINFMNLSTAQSEKRAREVGIRKVMGAVKTSLIYQFLGESLAMALFALVLAVVFIRLFLPVFNNLTNKSLSLSQNTGFIGWIAAVTLLTGLLAGLYPAFYLSSFKPASVLKGKLRNSFSAVMLRKGLVVFQFTISIILILGAMVIGRQLSFIQHQNLGFDKDQQIIIPLKSAQSAHNFGVLKDEISSLPDVVSASSGSIYPGIETVEDLLFYPEHKSIHQATDIHFAAVENDYIETLGLKIISGRGFSKQFTADSNSIILNETAAKELGFNVKTAVGKTIYCELMNKRLGMQIVGVVQNYNYESLHKEIKPFGLTTTIGDKHQYFITRVKTQEYSKLITDFEQIWKKLNPDTPFTYSFLDQDFGNNYEKEHRTGRIVIYFTLIAIVIACLGLFGLATFSAEQRTKEIGVRKVLGASVLNVVGLLSKDFIVLIFIAMGIAAPVGWYTMNRWLEGFAYKIGIEWWMFVTVGMLAVGIGLLTISFQSIKAALMNPVKSLKME